MWFIKKTDIKTTIENKINDSNGDIVKGDDLSLDASDNLTQESYIKYNRINW